MSPILVAHGTTRKENKHLRELLRLSPWRRTELQFCRLNLSTRTYPGPWHTMVKPGARAQFPPKLSLNKVKFSKIFAFQPKVKTVAEKLSFILRIWPGNLLIDILRDSQPIIFSHSTIFIIFFYKSLATLAKLETTKTGSGVGFLRDPRGFSL